MSESDSVRENEYNMTNACPVEQLEQIPLSSVTIPVDRRISETHFWLSIFNYANRERVYVQFHFLNIKIFQKIFGYS